MSTYEAAIKKIQRATKFADKIGYRRFVTKGAEVPDLPEEEWEFLVHSNWIELEREMKAHQAAARAWAYAKKYREDMSVARVLTIHEKLMRDVSPDIAGQWRNCTVTVGNHVAKYQPAHVIEQEVRNWLLSAFGNPGVDSKSSHIGFERLHPFNDGNGRVGRILMNIERLNKGQPILTIHHGEEQQSYYRWFHNYLADI